MPEVDDDEREKDRIELRLKKIRTRNELLLGQLSKADVEIQDDADATIAAGPRVPYPNVLSVSHSNVLALPKGMAAMKDTPVFYIESETAIEDKGTSHFYNIVDLFGRYIYIGQEVSWHRGSSRPFRLKLIDLKGHHVITMTRPPSWGLCCLGSKCKGNNLTVHDNLDILVGQIKQEWRAGLNYSILDDKDSLIMRVKGPQHISLLHPTIKKKQAVELLFIDDGPNGSNNEYVVGTFNVITQENKKSGFVFGMQFPLDFTTENKALVLAAGFLLNFTFCEVQPSKFINWYGSGLVLSIAFLVLVASSGITIVVLSCFGFLK